MPVDSLINESGETSGFDSTGQRTMKAALQMTDLKARFTKHDLGAKSASDVETNEQAAQLRGHLNVATTVKTYSRKPQTVVPLKGK